MKQLIESLKNTDLWNEKIKDDCKSQKVFLAIRKNRIDLYHKGGKLFSFDKSGFKTHLKYAAVIPAKGNENYLTEKELTSYKLPANFKDKYGRIKENCSNYSGVESAGVSTLYHKSSYLSKNTVVVLDIEVSYKANDENKSQDRIDILLYNKDTQALQFVEAKHYSNSELRSKSTPKVVSQIKDYNKQISNRNDQMLSTYSGYIRNLNSIFNTSLKEPKTIENKVKLLVFGFDDDQKKGGLTKIIRSCQSSDINLYSIGDISMVKTDNIWKTSKLTL